MTEDMQITAFQANLAALDKEITQLTLSDIDPENYFRRFLERMVAVLGAGGAVWRISDAGELFFIAHMNLNVAGVEQGGHQEQLLRVALSQVIERKEGVVLPSRNSSNIHDGGAGSIGTNDSPHTLLFIPVIERNHLRGIVLLISPPDVDPRAVRGFLGFLTGLCEKAGLYLQAHRVRSMEQQAARADRWRQYVSSLHSSLDPRRSCYALSNYGQELLGVYRCMAGTFNSRGKFRLESVSGLESVAIKSNFMQQIAKIARQVCRNNKALMVDNPNAVLSSDFKGDDLLNEARVYMLEANSVVLGIFPIHYQDEVVGAFVVEKAKDEPIDDVQQKQINALLAEAGSALKNGLTFRHMPLSFIVQGLGSLRDSVYKLSWARRAIWAAIGFIILVLPLVITRPVKVYGTAELIPIEARVAYAQQAGVIETVTVPDNLNVNEGDILATMDTRQIDSEIDRVSGSIDEALIARDESLRNRSASEARRFESILKSLQAEKKMYLQQREQYLIRAPVKGKVITRQSSIRHLLSKPVERGESVMEIVPDQSNWELTVNVPENEAGELLRAYDDPERAGTSTLNAKVILNAYPDRVFDTKVLSIAPRAVVLKTDENKFSNVIEVHVAQPDALRDYLDPRQGMEGKVAIECSRRSLYYVMTHEFIDFIRVSLF